MTKNKNDKEAVKSKVNGNSAINTSLQPHTKEYFKKLKLLIKTGLIVAFIAPLAAFSIYFHIQFNISLKESSKLHLMAEAESKKNTVDLFLQERVLNIFNLFHNTEFSINPKESTMESYLSTLRQSSDAFIDVGFFDSKGVQIGYAGPYPYLYGKDYSSEKWFTTLIHQKRNYFISDIYLGFRNKPHFTIAVKNLFDGKSYIMRATLDPEKFYLFLRTISRGKGVETSLVNKDGLYQVVDIDKVILLDKSNYMPSELSGSGAKEVKIDNRSILAVYTWLEETPWVLILTQPLNIAYEKMYYTRNIMYGFSALFIIIILAAIWITTDILINQAYKTEESKEELQHQLIHATKLASIGELAAGIAHEINNPLAIITAECGVIKDMFDPAFNLDASPEKIKEELDIIDSAVFRARNITRKLLNFARKSDPKLVLTDVNRILDNVVDGLIEREFTVSNIKLVREYNPDLPEILLDRDQITQVFLNIINNAHDAIEGSGSIILATEKKEGFIKITITDNGKGMTQEQMSNIFMPFYTTKEVGKGTGLGLSVSLGIVESMSGKIEVQSLPGAGSSFTVFLPINTTGGEDSGSKI